MQLLMATETLLMNITIIAASLVPSKVISICMHADQLALHVYGSSAVWMVLYNKRCNMSHCFVTPGEARGRDSAK